MEEPVDHAANERAALQSAWDESKGRPADEEPTSRLFYLIAVLGFVLAGGVALFVADPCAGQRAIWFMKGSGMRQCAWAAKCSINDGKYRHVPVGSGYIWFDKDSPSVCQGVKF